MADAIARVTFEVTTKAALRGITENLPELGSGVGSYKVEYLNGASTDQAAQKRERNKHSGNKFNASHKAILDHMEKGKKYLIPDLGEFIARERGLNPKTASPLLSVLASLGYVERIGKGEYIKL